ASTGTRPLDIRLFHSLNRVGSPVVSPNQQNALFVTSHYSQDLNKSAAYLSLLDLKTGNITRLTDDKPGLSVNNPLWFDDHTFGFVRKGVLYKQVLHSKSKAAAVFAPSMPISNVAYRPDQGILSFIAWTYPNATLSESAKLKKAESLRIDSAQVYDNLWARHWNEWMTLEKPGIFVASLDNSTQKWRVGEEVSLSKLLPRCNDPRTRWYVEDYAISPKGDNVAFTVRPPTENMTWSTGIQIYLAPTLRGAKPRLVTDHASGSGSNPVFSSDGKRLAWLQMETPGYESDINRIYIHDIAKHETVAVARDWNMSPRSLVWSADDKSLFTITGIKGRNLIVSVDVKTGARKMLTSTGSAGSLRTAGSQKLLYTFSSQNQSSDIHLLDIQGAKSARLTNVNKDKLDGVHLSAAEEFWFDGAGGDKVHGWLLRPYDFDSRKKYPLAYLIHGGPQQANIQSFSHSQWNPNMYASAGFVTALVNFHGSPTYSQNFTNSVRHKWGDLPYVDLMKGLDYMAAKYPFIDRSRMTALGGSFGAYMVNWINGHSDQFKCLVAHDGKFSTVSGYYGTDELWFPEWELGKPWEPAGRAILEQNNPERFAANFKTPTLFIQGEKDFRIPVSESFGAWTMLRRRGIPARLVYFPDEDHWINKQGNSVRWYTEVLRWISTYTNTTLPYSLEL
ncbi:dipeptidylpeptidase, partial [Dipsacomyces acuminosporus]